MTRHEFSSTDKKTLAERAGQRCSFPRCLQPTVGPAGADGVSLVGEACHINAASEGGPRYDPNQTDEERRSLSNAIWLCATHHALIDRDPDTYDAVKLRQWKEESEAAAKRRQEHPYEGSQQTNHLTFNEAQGVVVGDHAQVHIHQAPAPAVPKVLEPGDLPLFFHVPHRRNPDFVGRALDLDQLAQDLNAEQISAITPMAAATGLGGIGKTQLAIEFAYRNAYRYPGGVFWLNCAQEQQLSDELADCGLAMGLFKENDPNPLNDKVRAVERAWHEDQRQRLLIFDNCEEEDILVKWAPKSRHHQVLVTSRRQAWTVPGLKAHALATLSPSESVQLLRTQLGGLTVADALAIAAELAGLPLALFLAARYLDTYRYQIKPAAYLDALRTALTDHPSLHGQGAKGYQPTQHDTHVGRCFALSLDRLDPTLEVDALARQLLLHASYFAPGEALQPQLLLATLAESSASETPSEALHRLTELGLLRPEEGDQLSLHRLLGHYTQASYPSEARQEAEARVIETLLEYARAANESGLPARMSPILAHLRHQAERHFHEASADSFNLCNEMGYYLYRIASYEQAEWFYRRGLECAEEVYGPDQVETALSLNNLAQLLKATNRQEKAEPLVRRALTIDEAYFGADHPRVAVQLNSLAGLHMDTNQAKAEPLMRRALAIVEASFGADHPRVALQLNNLALLLQTTNRQVEAEPLMRRALAIDEASFGSDHPNVSRDLNNLACLLVATDRRKQALPLWRRALAIYRESLGADHPRTKNVQKWLDAFG